MSRHTPKLPRGLVWCVNCDRSRVIGAFSLFNGWPKCCDHWMTLDSPGERTEQERER